MKGSRKADVKRRGRLRRSDNDGKVMIIDSNEAQDDQSGVPRSTLAELPDALIEHVYRPVDCELPHKRRKLVADAEDVSQADCIIVKQSTHEIKFTGAKLKCTGTLERESISTSVVWEHISQDCWTPKVLEIREEKRVIYEVSLSDIGADQKDVNLALDIARHSKSKNSRSEGTLWTDIGICLFNRDGSDYLKLMFTVKWNVTSSLRNVARLSNKTPQLLTVLKSYFPDQHVTRSELTAQDFYTSVFQPQKDDESACINMNDIKSTLYPFQRRAVAWLLAREKGTGNPLDPPISFIRAQDSSGRPCYVSHLFGLVTADITPFQNAESSVRGGILAEEMGLGKTLEVIALISLHKRPNLPYLAFDETSGEILQATSATLIITPPSILQQWISECERHAPNLKVFHYEGLKAHRKWTSEELLQALIAADIVVSTYLVLAAEVHFTALNPERSLRAEAKYPRPKSPLAQLSWWRVCIDEAQMIDTGVSNAAVVANLIPRVNAWCITGTPVRKSVSDLLGMLLFLKYEPYASNKHIWNSLISWHKHEFRKLFRCLALRHSKSSIRDVVEEQHYQELFHQMCEQVGLDRDGAPLIATWNAEARLETMRRWLVRLRQTALHPEIGIRNRRALGPKDGALRTIDEVLEVMISQNDLTIRTDYRAILASKLKRGQLLENSPRVREALTIVSGSDGKDDKLDIDSTDASMCLGPSQMKLRGALDILHMAVFFRASAYYQIKSNQDMTKAGTIEFETLNKLESDGYEEAKLIRREILEEAHHKAEKLMIEMKKNPKAQIRIPMFATAQSAVGIGSAKVMEQLDKLVTALNKQLGLIAEWSVELTHFRQGINQFLLRPLVDEDEGVEMTGDEYEDSTKVQDEVQVLLLALQVVVADRHNALTGQQSDLSRTELRLALEHAKAGHGACPLMTIKLLEVRKQHRPARELGSIRGVVASLRALATSLKADVGRGSNRALDDLLVVEKQLITVQKQLTEQTKATAELEKEIEQFSALLNCRLDYYRQLQQVSDTVAPYEGPKTENLEVRLLEDEERLQQQLATAKSKGRYLEHLKTEAKNPNQQRFCTICKEQIELGALTVCGHQYCNECIRVWWRAHHNCPVCKKKLSQRDLHKITYKPQILSLQSEEVQHATQQHLPASKFKTSPIYREISKRKLAEIKNIELDGPSFTTKVDTLARHIIWLRDADPGAKSIIYSQFRDFLKVLAQAFQRHKIGFSSIDKLDGIDKFKTDPAVECFLLHARAHSSGLNLVNASHVFLCEPLLNTALELQAIARVDRIGQQQETSVWLYLVDGTVEESIHQLSVKRRLEHMGETTNGQAQASNGNAIFDQDLEKANSMELQGTSLAKLLVKDATGGELIENQDLWECLFGNIGHRKNTRALGNHGFLLD